jgi:hypothetical protein
MIIGVILNAGIMNALRVNCVIHKVIFVILMIVGINLPKEHEEVVLMVKPVQLVLSVLQTIGAAIVVVITNAWGDLAANLKVRLVIRE